MQQRFQIYWQNHVQNNNAVDDYTNQGGRRLGFFENVLPTDIPENM